ncbi:MAG: hypothetical protein ACOX3R_07205 [Desulfitobacteriia bacterium]
MNNKKIIFLAFIITASTVISQSSAYTSANIESNNISAVTEDEKALIGLLLDQSSKELKITNNLHMPIEKIAINEGENIVQGLLAPGESVQFEIPEKGDYQISAEWDGGSAVLNKYLEVAPISPGPKMLVDQEGLGDELLDIPVFEVLDPNMESGGNVSEDTEDQNQDFIQEDMSGDDYPDDTNNSNNNSNSNPVSNPSSSDSNNMSIQEVKVNIVYR